MKVEPLQETIPQSLITDPEAEAYFTRLHRWARDMWTRTGAGSDFIEDNQVDASRPRTRTTCINDLQGFHIGLGVPDPALGSESDFYFRSDGAAGAVIYHKESGTWTALA